MPEERPPIPRRPSLIISAILAVLIFGILALLAEGLFRSTRLNSLLLIRSLGIFHNQFEIKWFGLKDFVEENGGVDVILLGSSMVNTGINPQILATDYKALTGNDLRIYNFGVEGMTVYPNSRIARLLVEQYHPGALLFVTEMRDYAAANGVEVAEQFLADEWVTARLGGKETFRAWLKENSAFLQHILPFRNWSRADFLDTFLLSVRRLGDVSASGYEADSKIGWKVKFQPDPNDWREKENFALFSNYSIDPQRLDNLAEILSLTEQGTQVIITELPLYPTYFTYFGGESVHQEYLAQIAPFITAHQGIFLPPFSYKVLPVDYRVDYYHLNFKGAVRYSWLLGNQLVALCQDEGICLQRVAETP